MIIYKLDNPYLPFEYTFDSLERAQEAVLYFQNENNLNCKIIKQEIGENN